MFPARAPVPARAPFAEELTRRGRVWETTFDSSGVNHGYVRGSDGTVTTFDVPGAGTGSEQGTLGENINTPGMIDGEFIDASGAYHAFLRSKHGSITTYDVPGAGT